MGSFAFLRSNNHEWLNGFSFEDQVFTRDMAHLERKSWLRLFVYDACQAGQSKNEELGEAVKLSAAVTVASDYVVLKHMLGKETYPLALDLEADKYSFGRETFLGPKGQILGQLFYVRPQAIKDLDKILYNGIVFDRKRIEIDVEYRDKQGSYVSEKKVMRMKAWAYIANEAYWLSQEGYGITPNLFAPVRRCVVVETPLNSEKKSCVRYYYHEKFEI